jgi:hypothetical protein
MHNCIGIFLFLSNENLFSKVKGIKKVNKRSLLRIVIAEVDKSGSPQVILYIIFRSKGNKK